MPSFFNRSAFAAYSLKYFGPSLGCRGSDPAEADPPLSRSFCDLLRWRCASTPVSPRFTCRLRSGFAFGAGIMLTKACVAATTSLLVSSGNGDEVCDGGGSIAAAPFSASLAALVSASSSASESEASSKTGGRMSDNSGSMAAIPTAARISRGDDPVSISSASAFASARSRSVSGVRRTSGGGLVSSSPE